MPKSKTSSKASAASKAKPKAKARAPKKGKLAHGVEPITEGPYANAGPEGEARLAPGNEKQPEGTIVRLTSPGSVTV